MAKKIFGSEEHKIIFMLFLHDYCNGSLDYAARTYHRETDEEISPATISGYWRRAGHNFFSHGGARKLRSYEEVLEASQYTDRDLTKMLEYLELDSPKFPSLVRLCQKYNIPLKSILQVPKGKRNNRTAILRGELRRNHTKKRAPSS